MENSTQKQEFGPYSTFPIVHIDYSKNYSIIRTILESTEPKKSENKMTFKKWVLYFLSIHNPPKSNTVERKVLERKTLAERVDSFEVIKKGEEYYIKASLS